MVSLFVFIMPYSFALVSRYLESYDSARSRNIVDLFRSALLVFAVLVIVVYCYFKDTINKSCWENDFGQEIYRFTVYYPGFCVVLPFLLETIYGLLYSK